MAEQTEGPFPQQPPIMSEAEAIPSEVSSSLGLAFLRERGKDYIHRQPDDPEDIKSTREFCQEGIDLLRHTYVVLIKDSWGATRSEEFSSKFASVADTSNIETNPRPSGHKESRVFLRSGIMKNAITVNPRLLSADIDSALSFSKRPQDEFEADLYKRSEKPLSRKSLTELAGARQRLSSRYNLLDKTGLLEADPRIKKYLSVLYVIQAAKYNAVEETKHVVDIKVIGRPGVKVVPPEDTDQNIGNLRPNTGYIHRQLNYAFIGTSSLKQFAEEVGFSSKQEELLNEMAFMSKGDLPSGEFMQMLQPLADSLIKGNWEEAYAQRDFLIEYFPHMFPEWKVTGPRETTFKSINELMRNGQTLVDVTPASYKGIVTSRLAAIEDRLRARERVHEGPKERRRFGEQLLIEAMKKVSQQYKEGFDSSKPISEENSLPLPIGYERSGKVNTSSTVSVIDIREASDGGLLIKFHAVNEKKDYIGRLKLPNVIRQLIESQVLTEDMLNHVFDIMKDKAPQTAQNMSLKEVLTDTFEQYYKMHKVYGTTILDFVQKMK